MASSEKVRGIVFNKYYDVHNKTTRFSIAIPSLHTAEEFTVNGEIPFKGAEEVEFTYYRDKSGKICLEAINNISYTTVSDQTEEKTKANFQFQFSNDENKAADQTKSTEDKKAGKQNKTVEISLSKPTDKTEEKSNISSKIVETISNSAHLWRDIIPFYKDGLFSKLTNKKYSPEEISEIIKALQNSDLPATKKMEYHAYIRSKKVLRFKDLKNLEEQYNAELNSRVDKEMEKASKR